MFGGLWVSLALLLRCKCKTGNGSYLAWRKETAFGKEGQFPKLTRAQRRKSIRAWARWAFRIGAKH
jgi:hypothetical protein|tara:strand:- start:302 stop:499 length:198 start_codon:yes stop_codon:yes gene_type:complete